MHTSSSPTRVHDVVVVGARCAGAATGMLLARLGHDVVVVDRATFPSNTLSTHMIARSGVVQLHCWGLLDQVLESGAPAIREVSFHVGGDVLVRSVKDRAGVDLLVAPAGTCSTRSWSTPPPRPAPTCGPASRSTT